MSNDTGTGGWGRKRREGSLFPLWVLNHCKGLNELSDQGIWRVARTKELLLLNPGWDLGASINTRSPITPICPGPEEITLNQWLAARWSMETGLSLALRSPMAALSTGLVPSNLGYMTGTPLESKVSLKKNTPLWLGVLGGLEEVQDLSILRSRLNFCCHFRSWVGWTIGTQNQGPLA